MAIDRKNSRLKLLRSSNRQPKKIGTKPISAVDINKRHENMVRLLRYRQMWDALSDFRKSRRRNKEYFHGNQWNDIVEVPKVMPDGSIAKGQKEFISEAENIRRQGKIPLKNNVIASTVNSILGVYRQSYGKPEVIARVRDNQKIGEMNTCMAEYLYQINVIKEIDLHDLLEAMISGFCLQMIDYQWNRATKRNEEVVISYNPSVIFINSGVGDPRGKDIHTIGVLMDMPLKTVIQRFAKTTEDDERIQQIYNSVNKSSITNAYSTFTRSTMDDVDFFIPRQNDMCRVIQAWELESEKCWRVHDWLEGEEYIYPLSDKSAIDNMVAEREQEIEELGLDWEKCRIDPPEKFEDIYWYVRYLSPYGDVLYEGRTPFNHEQHPFAIYMGHLIDGEIHSFVEQIIDQQRYINRLITLIDFIMGASAKGVLVFPENAIPKGMTKEDILDQWISYNGVIFANLKPGMSLPQQIATNATNIGAQELLALQLQLVRDVSGVHGALQGKEAKSGTAASLYAQEASNAQVNIMDLLESFTAFRKQRDYKLIKVAPQCYNEEFYINISGKEYSEEAKTWNPEIAGSADIYINLEENNNTSTYRMLTNQILIKAMEMRLIDFETVLDVGGIPNADKIRVAIEKRKEELKKEQEKMQMQQAQAQAMQLQAQTAQQKMQEAGASEGDMMQVGADLAKSAIVQGEDTNNIDDNAYLSDLIKQALS